MHDGKSTVERALEIAKSGQAHSVEFVRRQLKDEGYENVDGHVAGSLSRQIRKMLEKPTLRGSD